MLIREGIIQNMEGMIIIPRIVLIQFMERFKDVDGSKVENKLVIIFN